MLNVYIVKAEKTTWIQNCSVMVSAADEDEALAVAKPEFDQTQGTLTAELVALDTPRILHIDNKGC